MWQRKTFLMVVLEVRRGSLSNAQMLSLQRVIETVTYTIHFIVNHGVIGFRRSEGCKIGLPLCAETEGRAYIYPSLGTFSLFG